MSDSLRPHGLCRPWNSPGQNIEVGSLSPSPGDLPKPGVKPRFPALQADSLPAEPQGKPTEKFCLLLVEFFFFFFLIEPKILCKFQVKVKVKSLSHVRFFVTLWTIAHHSPLSIEFSRQEYWSGLPFPSPGDLPNSVIKLGCPALQVDSLPAEPQGEHLKEVSYLSFLYTTFVLISIHLIQWVLIVKRKRFRDHRHWITIYFIAVNSLYAFYLLLRNHHNSK